MGNSVSAGDVAAVGATALIGVQLLTPANPLGRCFDLIKQLQKQEKALTSNTNVDKAIDDYNALHQKKSLEDRNKEYKSLVNTYYDLATLFYEWGWGQCFHFSYRYAFESFAEGTRRHNYVLASKLGLFGSGKKILDVGCGIGGPMRNIARFFRVHDITGITLNQYQVDRGNELNQADPLVAKNCKSVQGDFMAMPFEGEEFDAAYAIEAACHAPDRIGVYKEIYRILKPGAHFACYEWCLTDEFDPNNQEHLKIKKQIEEGDGLPDLLHTSEWLSALKEVGFEVLEERDLALDDIGAWGKPWMLPLLPSWNPFTQRFQFNWLGFRLTNFTVWLLEVLWLAPKGTSKTQQMLQVAGYGCGNGGKTKIFTPMYLMVGRKPSKKHAVGQ